MIARAAKHPHNAATQEPFQFIGRAVFERPDSFELLRCRRRNERTGWSVDGAPQYTSSGVVARIDGRSAKRACQAESFGR